MRLPGIYWRTWHRAANRLMDLWAVLIGACNRTTWDGSTYHPGYPHWRCMKRRGHPEAHRFNNYVWLDNGWNEYQPLPVLGVDTEVWYKERPYWRVTGRRYPTAPRRRERLQRRYWEEQTRQRRLARESGREDGPRASGVHRA